MEIFFKSFTELLKRPTSGIWSKKSEQLDREKDETIRQWTSSLLDDDLEY